VFLKRRRRKIKRKRKEAIKKQFIERKLIICTEKP
jgi:hypothetical protein